MKKIYLTFDMETIVSGISKNDNYLAGVYLGSMFIAEELRKRKLKGTFFISLSSKQKDINQDEYLKMLDWLIFSLKPYNNIKIEPHIHAYNLPLDFSCEFDSFGKYEKQQQIQLLNFAKEFFNRRNIEVSSFRPGGFSNNISYYDALKKAGIKNSSILEKNEIPHINMLTGEVNERGFYKMDNGIVEYPVTSVKLKSIKGKFETINLSPDFLTLESVESYLHKLNYININFHSFSVYLNRLIRENHSHIIKNNLKFLCFENVLNKLLKRTKLQIINTETVFSNELIKWLDFIENNYQNDTYFIGD